MKRKRVYKSYLCPVDGCGKSVKRIAGLEQHIQTHNMNRVKDYTCEVELCGKSFTNAGSLRFHQYSHGDPKFECKVPGCGQKFKYPGTFAKHKIKHAKEEKFICDFKACGKRFVFACELKKHMLTHTKEQTFVCKYPKCGKTFTMPDYLLRHIKVHLGTVVKNHKCGKCGSKFESNAKLVVHERVHTGDLPFVCDFKKCGHKFASLVNLRTHNRIHTGERSYKCGTVGCDQTFTQSGSLKIHRRSVHTKERAFKCDFGECKRDYKTCGALASHKLTHEGIKPYKCEFRGCGKDFTQVCNLQTHQRIHTNEKIFKCDHCSHSCTDQSAMQRHLDSHERQLSYEFGCQMQDCGTQLCSDTDIKCSIRTKTQLDMEYHIERNHTMEGIGKKFQSEAKLAAFLTTNNIAFDRDWANRINFKTCDNIQGGHASARPDFYLPEWSARLGCVVLIGNDEFAHRKYACDFRRIWNIATALEQTDEFAGVPILYIRFNPHHYFRDGVCFSHDLEDSHATLLETLQSIESVQPGVNLVYIHYDRTDNVLDIFNEDPENDYPQLFEDCVMLDV